MDTAYATFARSEHGTRLSQLLGLAAPPDLQTSPFLVEPLALSANAHRRPTIRTSLTRIANICIHHTTVIRYCKKALGGNSCKRHRQSDRPQCLRPPRIPLHLPHTQQVFPLRLRFLNALSFHTLLNGVFHLINMALALTICGMIMITPFGSEC